MQSESVYTSLIDRHTPKWMERAPARIGDLPPPHPLLGHDDANDDWTDELASEVFVHTESFKEYEREDATFLFGRRGVGKTALIRMLNHEANNGISKRYSSCTILDATELIKHICVLIRQSPVAQASEAEQLQTIAAIWRWTFAMSFLIAALKFMEGEKQHPALVVELKAELAAVTNGDRLVGKRVSRQLGESLIAKCNAFPASAIGGNLAWTNALIQLSSGLSNSSLYGRVLDVIRRTTRKLLLVQVDGEEVVHARDSLLTRIHTALIDCTTEAYAQRLEDRFVVKVAFAAELYPHLSQSNLEKVESRQIFVRWGYHDLVEFIARRIARMLSMEGMKVRDPRDIRSYQDARKFLASILPSTATTLSGDPMDTFAYVLRHTQKKPRQLLDVFNTIFTNAKEKHHVRLDSLHENPRIFQDGMFLRLDIPVGGAIDVYSRLYPRAEEMVGAILGTEHSYFQSSHLEKLLQRANSIRATSNLEKGDVRRMLFEVGALGVAHHVSGLPTGTKIVHALFEYQVKNIIVPTGGQVLVVHPMFYDFLGTTVDRQVVTYPTPAEDTEREVLQELGWGLPPSHLGTSG
jgi:hypothetical protein